MSVLPDARTAPPVPAQSPAGPASSKKARLSLPALVVLIAFLALCVVLYRAGTHAGPVDSDSATVVLEGAALAHGHLTLSGWALSRDSFWTIDALFYMIGVLIEGIRPSLLYVVPAVLAALVVLAAAGLARGQASRTGRVVAVLAVLAVLALPSRALSLYYLQGPYHVGTALYALVAFACLRSRRFGWGWLAAVAILGLGMLGDLQLAVFGSAAAFGAGLLAMARRRSVREGLWTALAAPASVLVAFVVREVADRFGTFAVNPANPQASPLQMIQSLAEVGRWGIALLGVGSGPYVPTEMPTALSDLHVATVVVIVLAVVAAVFYALRGALWGTEDALGSRQGEWHLEDLLVLAFLADIAAFARLYLPGNPPLGRYLTAAIIFGAILAARLLGRLADGLASRSRATSGARESGARADGSRARRRLALGAGAVGIALLAAYIGGFVDSVQGPPAVNPASALSALLEQHGLTRGLGDYWSASIVTVESAGRVVVRPVIDGPTGRVVRYERQSDAAWYAHQRFQFIVYDIGLGLINVPTVEATFGTPSERYLIGPYEVLAFSHPLTVSTVGVAA